jgi:hypothetical protein
MIAPGSICTCEQTGAQLWVVVGRAHDGLGWRLIGKFTNHFGHAACTGRTAGEGDLTLIKDAPTFEPGAEVEHGGKLLTVIEDLGDEIEFEVPASSRPLRGGGALRIAAGNTTTIYKADLTLENMR